MAAICTPGRAGRSDAAPLQRRLLLGCGCFGGGLGVLLLEALDAAGGVHELLFAGEEGMAIRANFHAQHVAFDGRARLEGIAAGAVHCNGMIVGMNAGFHGAPIFAAGLHGCPSELGLTAASLGREQMNILREKGKNTK